MTTLSGPPGGVRDPVDERGEGTLLYASGRTRIVRRPAGVIWKEALGPGATTRMQHETSILAGLSGVPGVAHLVGPQELGGFALEDVGGVSLASTLSGT